MKKLVLILMILSFGLSVQAVSLDEMIGQMIIVGFHGKNTCSPRYKTTKKQLKNGEISGVIIFEHNIKDKKQLTQLTSDLKNTQTKYTPFISIDQEGGMVARLNKKNGFKDHLTANKVANTKNLKQAYIMYDDLAKMCKSANFNLNFTPDVDLLINKNSIIAKKERSYSKNPYIVSNYAKECIKAHANNKIATSLKHFPGHGSPVGDTHLGFVDASDTWSEQELVPYKQLSKLNNLQMVMVSHVFVKKLDDKFPASMSPKVINGMLREQIGFQGVVITDDLHMGAIRNNYSLDEIVVNAINAGNDILLFSNFKNADYKTPKKVNKIIKQAIADGKITQAQIENSYQRIVTLKKNLD